MDLKNGKTQMFFYSRGSYFQNKCCFYMSMYLECHVDEQLLQKNKNRRHCNCSRCSFQSSCAKKKKHILSSNTFCSLYVKFTAWSIICTALDIDPLKDARYFTFITFHQKHMTFLPYFPNYLSDISTILLHS